MACGSVLAAVVHAADGSFSSTQGNSQFDFVTAGPGAVSGGHGAMPLAVARSTAGLSSGESRVPPGNRIRSGPVVRNPPLAVGSPSASPFDAEHHPLRSPGAADAQVLASGPVKRMAASWDHTVDPTVPTVRQAVVAVAQVVQPVTGQTVSVAGAFPPVDMLPDPGHREGAGP